jgi:hypothetical protein
MPPFSCHVWRKGQLTPDEVGVALSTLDAAKRRAGNLAFVIDGQVICGLRSLSDWDIEVTA